MKRKVFIAIPTVGSVVDSLVHRMRQLEELYTDQIEFIYPTTMVRRVFHDFARNQMVEDFLESDAEVMWFIDSDITPPLHALDLVTMHWDTWELAGCPYPIFMTPPGEDYMQVMFAVYTGNNGKALSCATKIPKDGTEFVDGVATGCMFIKREVFAEMEKPYFNFVYDAETRNIAMGEDLGFCLKMVKLGKKFLVDYSMICKHEKRVCLLDINNYAIDFTNKSLINFEYHLKTRLSEALASKKAAKAIVKSSNGLVLPERFNVK